MLGDSFHGKENQVVFIARNCEMGKLNVNKPEISEELKMQDRGILIFKANNGLHY